MDDLLSLLQLLGSFVLLGLGLYVLWRGLHWLRDRELAERERRRSGLPPEPDLFDRLMERYVIKGRPLEPTTPQQKILRRWMERVGWVSVPFGWSLPVLAFVAPDRLLCAVAAVVGFLVLVLVALFALYLRSIPRPASGGSPSI